ncbi:uncharacterized protein DUF3572 [Pacificibacter maritimus]|uniref:Uncharacterized protein DUF3572 n=1 Tax=Pacificibacter maritimus TaxID=762213 RepID=A0A3N4VDT6_9RHOB|nr:DUF3572 domain-containing protein [Pacificibacter maritimus]RPE72020.1 uncharacterized protein DUF3572 [Pacificibacter maritimus]
MKQETAETIALKILVWIVGNDEILPIFLSSTGLGEDDLRARAGETELLTAVLDFITMNDEWVNDCATSISIDPHDFLKARQSMPGGADIHWT